MCTIWDCVQRLCPDSRSKVLKVYEEAGIPIYIRHHLAQWIETHLRELNPMEVLKELQNRFNMIPFYNIDRDTHFQELLATEYTSYPERIQNKLLDCLKKETEIIKQEFQHSEVISTTNLNFQPTPESNSNEFSIPLAPTTQTNSAELWALVILREKLGLSKDHLAKFECQQQGFKKLILSAGAQDAERLKIEASMILQTNSQLDGLLNSVIKEVAVLQRETLQNEIKHWKFEQKKACIGFLTFRSIEMIKQIAEGIYSILWETRTLLLEDFTRIKTINPRFLNEDWSRKLGAQIDKLITELFQMTFLIMPPANPIFHFNNRFPILVSCLVAIDRVINLKETYVKAELITEEEAENIFTFGLDQKNLPKTRLGMIKDNVSKMGTSAPDRTHYGANFNLRLTSYKSASRRKGQTSTQLVTDKTYYILCTTEITIPGTEIKIPVSQDCAAWGTIVWNYGFSSIENPFNKSPERADWSEIITLLALFFKKITGTQLTQPQYEYLTRKAMNSAGQQRTTFYELFKDKDNKDSSFWEWFYFSMKSVEKYFPKLFKHFHGFIDKKEAERLLFSCQIGTFLIRFSDSIPGAISIVYSTSTLGKNVHILCERKDFDTASLEEKVNDLNELKFLYPSIPKEEIFIREAEWSREGYEFKPDYTRIRKKYFLHDSESVNFEPAQSSDWLTTPESQDTVDIDQFKEFLSQNNIEEDANMEFESDFDFLESSDNEFNFNELIAGFNNSEVNLNGPF